MTPLAGLRGANPTRDLVAGITVAAIAIPENLGYATIAGLPVQTGLYCALVPAILFALVGSSRQLVVGGDSATVTLVAAGAAVVAAVGSPEYTVAVGVIGLLTAAVLALMVVARLDFMADLISRPVLAGFLTGVGISLILGNLPSVLGVRAAGTPLQRVRHLLSHLDEVNPTAALLGVGTVLLIVGVERWLRRVPAALLAILVMATLAAFLHAQAKGVTMVGAVPAGLPSLAWPSLSLTQTAQLAGTAVSIAIVVVAQSAAVSRGYAVKREYEVDVAQDMAGLAAANLGSAVTSGFAISGSPPRTEAADDAGGRSQVVSLVMAACVAVVLLWLTGLFEHVPNPVLDAVVLAIGIRLLKVRELAAVARASRAEVAIALVTAVTVALVGVEEGILLAVLLSLVDRLGRLYRPHSDVLVDQGEVASRLRPRLRMEGSLPPGALDGVIVFRFGAPLFFANAENFASEVRALIAGSQQPVRLLVLDCAAMEDIDYTGAQTLATLGRELGESGGRLVLTEVTDAVVRMVAVTDARGQVSVIPRIEDAVRVLVEDPDAEPGPDQAPPR